ncbi:mycoredoxin [Corynebacterium felinum]|uniref:Mycoredoxin n=1 Tax=Corynebacterium felinum TaxID=131318 RepID=A0ABU2BBB1_9CORY|nr:mycoredoxin [Corynebacterium felinum]MDF5819652.1 mycoredoxin [Corynebacterium felinum]MDR7355033.1 mycoredoxin [Corynebacterium felinum]WJY94386.1 Mycoredoxin 1 [Corynebacterium felinum]
MSTNHITVYATTWCPFCKRLLADLAEKNVPFDVIDVDEDAAAGEWVKSVNDGNRVVPTVRYSDGTHATNPPARAVERKLAQLR